MVFFLILKQKISSVLEVANGEYGNFNPQMAAAALDDRWRLPGPPSNGGNTCLLPNSIADNKPTMLTTALPIEPMVKTTVSRVESNDSRDVHAVPSEWAKFWVLVGRCHVHYYRDWVSIRNLF